MPKVILELDKRPGSCAECPCGAKNKFGNLICQAIVIEKFDSHPFGYRSVRRPDCPLKPIEKPAKQQEYCPNCGYKTVSDGKHVCCFACGYNV